MLGPSMNADGAYSMPEGKSEPPSPEVEAILAEQGLDLEISGLKYLNNEGRMKALAKKASKVEKMKNKKAGGRIWKDIEELAALVRSGEKTWEELDLDDIDVRTKWAGLFHRKKRAAGTFMMRLKVPNGEITSTQLRVLGNLIKPYGDEQGVGDITSRANFQLRGITVADSDKVMKAVQECGLSSVMSGMDNVRNMTGSPIAGIDPHELLDVRPLNYEINNMITNYGKGNYELSNLPRKINFALSPSRDDFPHVFINDVGLQAIQHPETGEVGFNVELGGYFSIKRNAQSINGNTFLRQDQVVAYLKALLEFFRDAGNREDRQKARLMWLVEACGVDQFRKNVAQYMGLDDLPGHAHVEYKDEWKRRDVIGIHPQKQDGFYWACACVPSGRISSDDYLAFADIADKYGDGTARATVEGNILFPFIPEEKLEDLQKEPLFQKYSLNPRSLTRGLVSCTGSQFCGVAIIETKQRAAAIAQKLDEELDIPQTVRMHWTGCPNSCGQVQVADIGLMGGPARLDGKAVEGVRLFTGGKVGEGAELGKEIEKGIACNEEVLLPKLREILINQYGAKERNSAKEEQAELVAH